MYRRMEPTFKRNPTLAGDKTWNNRHAGFNGQLNRCCIRCCFYTQKTHLFALS